jgi:cytochrome c oxidase cbb3-type subunit 1
MHGAQDAIVQWWYGHNAVGFLLTGSFLGMLYYFLPKQAERPIWSYKLSIVAFWAFTYSYIWAGPHHLHYNSIPEWVQSTIRGRRTAQVRPPVPAGEAVPA